MQDDPCPAILFLRCYMTPEYPKLAGFKRLFDIIIVVVVVKYACCGIGMK